MLRARVLFRKTKFPFRLWYWTGPDESLFALTKEELFLFILFVENADAEAHTSISVDQPPPSKEGELF